MQPSIENVKQDQLHWICGVSEPKMKLNLGEFYKASFLSEENAPPHSCTDENRKSLTFEQKGPYVFRLYNPLDQEPKSQALDVFFEEPVTVAEIKFQNHYVAYLSVLIKFANRRDWETMIQRRQLMPHPHYETGSRSYFEIVPVTSQPSTWNDVTEIRLVLQQPSPNWKHFYIENLYIFNERKSEDSHENIYATNLINRTIDALKMERRNEKKPSSKLPFQIGTCGYEIDKLPKF